MPNDDHDRPIEETDERFPSGNWRGFWLQPMYADGRQRMSLRLTFADGHLEGAGEDRVGPFVVKGTYDTDSGKAWFRKTYLGQHVVAYEGHADGTNLGIWGVWELMPAFDRGGFHIWPEGQGDHDELTTHEAADVPAHRAVLIEPSRDAAEGEHH